jgi:hypothetical protein
MHFLLQSRYSKPLFLDCIKKANMKKNRSTVLLFTLVLATLMAACGNTSTTSPTIDTPLPATPIITSTPDPCAPENIQAEVQKIHNHMREFDDASALAASVPRDQLSTAIANLQAIRRAAEDQPIPPCLGNLKSYQVAHMNSVINTLLAFMNGSDQSVVDQGIAMARQQHDQYTIELARLLGITMEPPTALPTDTLTPVPTP